MIKFIDKFIWKGYILVKKLFCDLKKKEEFDMYKVSVI